MKLDLTRVIALINHTKLHWPKPSTLRDTNWIDSRLKKTNDVEILSIIFLIN